MNIAPLLDEAERYLEAKDVDRAAVLFTHAHEQCAGLSPLPLVGLARVALIMNRTTEAKALLDGALLGHPRCALAISMRGVVAEVEGELEGARTLHLRALGLEPTLSIAHLNLGRLHAQTGAWDQAAASLTLAIRHGADQAQVKVQLGTALFRAGRRSEALRLLALTVGAHPTELDAALTLADVLVEVGQLQQAFEVLAASARHLPEAPLIASRQAAIALRMKDLEAARREAWRTTTLAPNDEEAWLFAAIVDTMKLELSSALDALRGAIRANPKSWRAFLHLGGVLDALKKKSAAKRAYRRAIELNERAWEPTNNLSVMLMEEGSPESLAEAKSLLERALATCVDGDLLSLRYNLALVCARLQQPQGTRRAAQALLDAAPKGHPLAIEAQRLLKVA